MPKSGLRLGWGQMMRCVLATALMFAGGYSPAPVMAATGNEVLLDCAKDSTEFKASYCFGYVVGAAEMASAILSLGGRKWFCAPDNVTNGQLERVIAKYVENNPAKTSDPAAVLVLTALVDAFPCPKQE